MDKNFHKIYGKNGPRISICIIKTRTCRADLQVESTKTKVFFSVFDLSRRRCVADLHRDWFLFPSRALQQWGLLESWHNTSEQRLRTFGFCTGSGDHGGMEMFFSSRESEVPAIAEVSLSPRVFWWKQMETFSCHSFTTRWGLLEFGLVSYVNAIGGKMNFVLSWFADCRNDV